MLNVAVADPREDHTPILGVCVHESLAWKMAWRYFKEQNANYNDGPGAISTLGQFKEIMEDTAGIAPLYLDRFILPGVIQVSEGVWIGPPKRE